MTIEIRDQLIEKGYNVLCNWNGYDIAQNEQVYYFSAQEGETLNNINVTHPVNLLDYTRQADYKETLQGLKRAKVYQGKELAQLPDWTDKPDFKLCPELWFWAFNAQNPVYPSMMIVSFTPFWNKGQAEIHLSVEIDRLTRLYRRDKQ